MDSVSPDVASQMPVRTSPPREESSAQVRKLGIAGDQPVGRGLGGNRRAEAGGVDGLKQGHGDALRWISG